MFWRRSIVAGWQWFVGVTDHVGRALTVTAIIGVPALALLSFGWSGLVAGVGAVTLLALAEGAFQTWYRVRNALAARNAEDALRAQIRSMCSEWAGSIETFLDARAAKAPGPRGGLLAQLRARPLTVEQQEACDSYDRETISLYVETYRERGVKLFDLLVDLRTIVPTARTKVHSPRTPLDIRSAAETVVVAASRLERAPLPEGQHGLALFSTVIGPADAGMELS